MRRLAARRSASIEHPAAGRWRQQLGGPLRTGVLDRNGTLGEIRQCLDHHRSGQGKTGFADRSRFDADRLQANEIGVARRLPKIDPQTHRRRLVASRDDALPVGRIGRLQLRQPPVRMLRRSDRIGSDSSHQGVLLAQEIAQHAIDQTPELAAQQFAGGENRLVDHGMHRLRPGFDAVEGNQQQGADFIHCQRPLEQAGEHEIAPAVGTQAAVDKILHGWPGDRIDPAEQAVGQTLPGKHGSIDAGSLQQGVGEGIERQSGHRPRLSHGA